MHRLLAVLLVLALGAAACGDDDTPDAGPDDTDTEADDSSTAAPTTTAAPTSVPTTTAAPRPAIPVPEATDLASVFALERPVVIGHAGGDQSWPHSTMYAFVQAAVAGTDVLEMDVQLTADGVLVVQHDDTVDKTTETTGRVRDLTYDELQALDNAYWWSDAWASHDEPDDAYIYRGIRTGEIEPPPGFTPDDFRVETFRSIATTFPDHVLDIELKVPDGDDGEDDLDFAIEGARVLAEEIAELGRTDSVVVVSFNDDVMAAFREFAPDVATSPGTTSSFGWIVGGTELADSDVLLQVPPFYQGIDVLGPDLDLLGKAEAAGIEVWAWPNDAAAQENADFYEELIDIGVDGVIAGSPEIAVERYATLG